MYELGYENISGTPSTSASLTLTAISSPIAYPRMSAVGPASTPIYYIIENSSGQVLCAGVGLCASAGSFTRVIEFSHWNGTTYTRDPGTLYDLPSGCKVYCGVSVGTIAPLMARHESATWFEPAAREVTSATMTFSANRDYWFRFRNEYAFPVDQVAVHIAAAATLDVGIYTVDPSDASPSKLLLGWQGVVAGSGGMVEMALTSVTLGVMSAAAQPIPMGDLYVMVNVSASAPGRVVTNGSAISGSLVSDLANADAPLYANRTNNTSFGDDPTITGRITTTFAHSPALVFRAE